MRSSFLAGAFLAASAVPAAAETPAEPYFTSAVEVSRALALELIGVNLTLAQSFAPPLDEELAERFEAMAGPLWQKFGGTLEQTDAALAGELKEALAELAEAAEEGEETDGLAAEAEALRRRAYELIVPAELRDSAAFKGALLVELLLVEGGVAEGYEEATENVWEYPGGWAALQRVDRLWADISPPAAAAQRQDGEEMLKTLHALFPDAGPPASTTGWNPEEAEAPAQRLGGIVEGVAAADLYPGRDLARLAGHLADVTGSACPLYAAGNDAVAAESIAAAATLYMAHLSDTVDLFAPEENEEAEELFGTLVAVGGEEEEEDDEASPAPPADNHGAAAETDRDAAPQDDNAAASEHGADDAAVAALPAADTCKTLSETLGELRGVLGG